MAAVAAPVAEALAGATEALAAAGVDSPRLDAELLLCESTGWDRARLATEPEAPLPTGAGREFAALIRRRLRREPLAYITGRKAFRNLELAVDPRALIPRPESEMLVELAVERRPVSVLDVGTGSGAIALAVADELPRCEIIATDTSPEALELARDNATRLGFAMRVSFEPGTVPAGRRFDLLLANLPYVPESDWEELEPEIRDFEPRPALTAGDDGLDAVRELLDAAPEAGTVALEIGEGQAAATAALLEGAGFPETEIRKDLAGIERVVIAS